MTPAEEENTPVEEPNTPPSQENAPPSDETAWELPPDLRREVDDLGGRASEETWRGLLLRLCRQRAWTADELADLTGRKSRKHLVRRHLTPMVKDGLLNRTRRRPNDPSQEYEAADRSDEQDR